MKPPSLKLKDGNLIPQIGLGLWQVTDKNQFDTAIKTALKTGYRHFDTAQYYRNEDLLGQALKDSGIKREECFITTKIQIDNFRPDKLEASFNESLTKLQTDYVDLLLLHFPVTFLRKKAWQRLEEIKKTGKAKSIGVSNYTIRHLKEMEGYASEKPVINQVELHLFLQQPELRDYCRQEEIQVEAYSPLARGHIMDNPVIMSIAKKHDKTYAQIMLRWLIEQDLVVIPKSVTPERIKENFNIFDFRLDQDDLEALKVLDQGKHTTWNPTHVP